MEVSVSMHLNESMIEAEIIVNAHKNPQKSS